MDPKLAELNVNMCDKVYKVLAYLQARGWEPKIAEALRTKEQQQAKVDAGYSKTMHSKHLEGLAADIIDQRYGWSESCPKKFWIHLGMAAQKYGLRWGGTFGLLGTAKTMLKVLFAKGDSKTALRAKLGWDIAHIEWQ
jgi:hypothetical protein